MSSISWIYWIFLNFFLNPCNKIVQFPISIRPYSLPIRHHSSLATEILNSTAFIICAQFDQLFDAPLASQIIPFLSSFNPLDPPPPTLIISRLPSSLLPILRGIKQQERLSRARDFLYKLFAFWLIFIFCTKEENTNTHKSRTELWVWSQIGQEKILLLLLFLQDLIYLLSVANCSYYLFIAKVTKKLIFNSSPNVPKLCMWTPPHILSQMPSQYP
jgi:hypothetical protein